MNALAVHPRRWRIFGLLAGAQFMVILDASVIIVALASIQKALRFSPSDLQWVVNGYLIAFGGLLLLGGRVADLIGRKRTFLIGMSVFTLASLAGGLAQTQLWLIIARAVQGLGAAFLAPAALSLVMTVFTNPAERTKAMGLWGAVSGAAGTAGVLAGGTLTEGLGWESTLLVNVPIGAVLLLAVSRTVPEHRARTAGGFDLGGAVTVVSGLATLIFGIVNANKSGWGSATTLGTLAAAAALLTAFVVIETRVKDPLVDLRFVTSRNVGRTSLVAVIAASVQHPQFYFGGLLMQQALGYSPLQAGLAWLPMSLLVMVIAGGGTPRLIARFGASRVLALGATLLAGGLLTWAHAAAGGSYVSALLPALLVSAPGMALVFVSVTVSATSAVPEHQAGLASGLLNMSQQIGAALGLAVLVSLSTSRTTAELHSGRSHADALAHGFSGAFHLAAAIALIAATATVLLLVRSREPAPSMLAAEGVV
jgi:EmrB/QacA subfamily drug resistance transporter